MLGMMNSPSDGVEFYSTNPKNGPQLNEEDRKAFTEIKDKDIVSYTEDGRRLINGKTEKIDPNSLWGSTLLRGHVKVNILVEKDDIHKSTDDNSDENASEIPSTAAAAAKKDIIELVEPPLLAHAHPSVDEDDNTTATESSDNMSKRTSTNSN